MKSAGQIKLLICRSAILATLVIGANAFLAIVPAFAQDATLPTKEVNITLNQAPVRTALDTLFKSAGLNYTIDPSVTGLVTVSLRAIPFDVALRQILRASQPPLAFTVEDGVYNIHPRVEQIEVSSTGTGTSGAPATPAAPTDTTSDQSTISQVVPLRLEYANAALILRYALSGPNTGYIPSLDAPPTSSGGRGGSTGGTTGGFGGGSTGGFGGGSTGGFGGGSTGGFGGGSTGGFGGGSTGGFGGGSTGF